MNETSLKPERIARAQMSLIDALQDVQCSNDDKRVAVACLLETMIQYEEESYYRSIERYLGLASRINKLCKEFPQGKAVERFVKYELN